MDVVLNYAVVGAIQNAIHMKMHDPVAAVRSMEKARPYDFCTSLELAPAYYRGLAYLGKGDRHAAAMEFQRVMQHRSVAEDSPYVPLSQMELGHVLQIAGDSAGARNNYQYVLAVWKNADPGFPPLRQVRQYQKELGGQH